MPYADPTQQLVIEIFVRDAARSRAFYERLGFAVRDDRGDFVILAWDDCELFLDQRPDVTPPTSPVANVRVMTPDVDAMWRRALANGARIVAPIANRPYGLRDFTIADPDGFGVRFGAWLTAGHQD
ncbi:MAG TPA: VOC family protein [Thermomicrobiales bacterium]|jgi:catechol 2,3-dioxygenase-like lactoylglutathione lyase family enzyme|nr:VOC family protein [Thermomicrobiales bacterium]